MGAFEDVLEFSRLAQHQDSLTDLENLIEASVRTIGMDYFTLVHHVDLTDIPGGAVGMNNYPASWIELQLTNKYFVDDPVHAACSHTTTGFLWSDLPTLIDLNARHKRILKMAQGEGLGDGYSIPVHLPGDCSGSCSFGMRYGRDLAPEMIPAAQVLGSFAFEATRRLVRKQMGDELLRLPTPPRRQLECLIWLGRGKTDYETGRILGISEETVRKHIDQIKRRYGVTSRQQVISMALYQGHVTYRDLNATRVYPVPTRFR